MISKSAVENFLKRELDTFNWIKEANEDLLLEQFAELDYIPVPKTEPWVHQLACLYIGICFQEFLFLLDMGTGKTKIVLDLAQYYKDIKVTEKILVVVPTVLNVGEWKDEVEKHSYLRYVSLHGTKAQREKALASDGDVYVVNYDGLQTFMTGFEEQKGKTKGGKKKRKRAINEKLVREFIKNFNMVVFDEIHEAKNSDSMVFRLCNRVAKSCDVRYGLTGTPTGRDPIDFWAEFYLVDRGSTLGAHIGLYREAFFISKINHFAQSRYGKIAYNYTFDKRKQDKLNRVLQNRSIVYAEDECQNLPPKIHKEIHISLTDDALAAYRILLEKAEAARGTEEQENIYSKLRQICSGFQYVKTEDEDTKDVITYATSEKFEALESVLDDMPPKKKLVIFHVFVHSGEMIVNYLKKNKIKFAAINSTAADPIKEKEKFQRDPSCKVVVVNIASGSSGLNFQMANYTIFWEPTDRIIWYKQALKRTNRGGQKFTTFYYHFFVRNSIEERVRSFLEEGESIYKALLKGKVKAKDMRL